MEDVTWTIRDEEGTPGTAIWCCRTLIASTLHNGRFIPLYIEGESELGPRYFSSPESVEDTLRGLDLSFVREDT